MEALAETAPSPDGNPGHQLAPAAGDPVPQAGARDRTQAIVQHLTALKRYARALAGDHDRANDLLQDAVTKALAAWGQLQEGGSVKAWLYAIMRNHFLQEGAKRNRWRTILSDAPLEEVEAPAPEAQTSRLALQELDAALAELPDEQRETLVLVAVEGMSYAEAAAVTGVAVGTVMSRLSRARQRLRQLTDPDAAPARGASPSAPQTDGHGHG